ncbi:hypothetical protein N9Z90_02220 [Synechococcus sp. AH-707-D15]|nr:hypothetical protein [Synechococcus sp. AH-707-D15]
MDHAFWLFPADAYRTNVEGDEETGHINKPVHPQCGELLITTKAQSEL